MADKSENQKVSIALPLYSGEATILSSIRSIVLQTYENWELVVLDDGSTYNSPEIVRSIADPRIRFVQDNLNRGISFRLNQGHEDLCLLVACQHDVIAISSLSWWGAWLGRRGGKKVVAPLRWFKNSSNDTSDLIPLEWYRL